MTFERHAHAEMLKITGRFSDGAAMVGLVAQANHFMALRIFHQRSRISRGTRLITRKCSVAYGMNTIFPILIVRRVRPHHQRE